MIIVIHVTINGKQGVLTKTNKTSSVVTFPDGTEQRIPNTMLRVTPPKRTVSGYTRREKVTYFTHGEKTEGGYAREDIDDAVARELRTATLGDLYAIAARESGADEGDLRLRFGDKARGVQSMALRNIIRKARKQ